MDETCSSYGLTIVDFIAPCFFFIIGLTFYISFNNRIERDDENAAIRHFRIRGLAIYGIGSLLATIQMFSPFTDEMEFNILQAIAISMLVVIPYLMRPFWLKIIVGVLIGIGEHFLLLHINGPEYMLVDARSIGVMGWIGFLFLSLAMGDLFFACRRKNSYQLYWLISGSFLIAGAVLSLWIPVFHSAATLSYNLITIGTISLFFFALFMLTENRNKKRGFLCIWGSNPLLAYTIHFVLLIGIEAFSIETSLNHTFPVIFTISLIAYFGIIQGLLILVTKKGIIVKI